MKKILCGLCLAVLSVPSFLGAVTTHVLEIEGEKLFSQVRTELQGLIQPNDNISLIFRGEGASLTLDVQPRNLTALTITGNGSILLADGLNPFTVDSLHVDTHCTSLTVDGRLLDGLFAGGMHLTDGRTLTVVSNGNDVYSRTVTMEPGTTLKKTGTGTLTLSAESIYGGSLDVREGTLKVSYPHRDGNCYPGGITVHKDGTFVSATTKLTDAANLGEIHIYGALQIEGVWDLPGASSAKDARLFLHAGCAITGDAPFRFENGGGVLAFRKGADLRDAAMQLGTTVSSFNSSLWVDVEDGVKLAMPPPRSATGETHIKKVGAGRWYVRDKSANPVHYSYHGWTDVEEGSLFVYSVGEEADGWFGRRSKLVTSTFSVARGGRLGGTALIGRDSSNVNRGGWQGVTFASGGGVDWRAWDDTKPREQLRFYNGGTLTLKGCFPYIDAGADFTIVDYKKPAEAEKPSLFANDPLINFNGNAARENFATLKLTFITDEATFLDSYTVESVWHGSGRDFVMTGSANETVVSAVAEVYADEGTTPDTYSALPVKPPANGDLTLYYRPYKTTAGTFVFDLGEQTLPVGDLSVTGTPGTLDASGTGKLTYTGLTTQAPLTVTPGFLNRIANKNPAAFILPFGQTTTVRPTGGETTIEKAIDGDDPLVFSGTLTLNSTVGPLITTALAPNTVLSFGPNGRFRGAVVADGTATLCTGIDQTADTPADTVRFEAPLVLSEGVTLKAAVGEEQVLRADNRITLPPKMTLDLTGTDGNRICLMKLGPNAKLLGIPPLSVALTLKGVPEGSHYELKEETGTDGSRELIAEKRILVATSVKRTVASADQWYDAEHMPWINTEHQEDTYNIPPQDVHVTVYSKGTMAGLGLNVSPRIKTLTVNKDPAYSGTPYFSVVSTGTDAVGRSRTLTVDSIILNSFCYFWPDTVLFDPDSADKRITVNADGILAGSLRVPHLTLENGAILQVADGKVAEVTESLTLPNETLPDGTREKWNVRVTSGSWGETKILSVLPTATVTGWIPPAEGQNGNANIEFWDANGERMPDEELARCSIIQKTDGFYIRKDLPEGTILVTRTLTCDKSGSGNYDWNASGAWVQSDVNGNPLTDADTYAQPPTNAFVFITLDARQAPSGQEHVINLTMNATANPNSTQSSVLGLKIHSVGGSPILKTQFAAGNTVKIASGESWLQCTQEVAAHTLDIGPGTLFLDKFHMDVFTNLIMNEDNYVFQSLDDIAWNQGTVTFMANEQQATQGHRTGTLTNPYEFFSPRRIGHLHIGPNTAVKLVKNKTGGSETIDPDGPAQAVTNFTVTGESRDSSRLILMPGALLLHTNNFPAENVTVQLGDAQSTNQTLVFGPGAYLGPRARLDVQCTGSWETLSNVEGAAEGHPASVTVGSLCGAGSICLPAAEFFEIQSLESADFAGAFCLRKPSAAPEDPAPAAELCATVRIRPEVPPMRMAASPDGTPAPAPKAAGDIRQTFSGDTADAVPLEVDGSRLTLNGTWGGPITVMRDTHTADRNARPGEIGGKGTIATGGSLTLEPGTVLDITENVMTVEGSLSLPDPLTIRVSQTVFDGSFNAPLLVLYANCEQSGIQAPENGILPNAVTVVGPDNTLRGGAYRLVCEKGTPEGQKADIYLQRIVAKGTLSEAEMCWAQGGIGTRVDWTDAQGNKLGDPLPDDIDVELTVTQTDTNLDINNTGVAHLNSLTVIGEQGNEKLTFLDSAVGSDTLDVDTIRIGTTADKPARVVAKAGIGSLGQIKIEENSSLTVQENLENVGTLEDSPGWLVFQNPNQNSIPTDNPKFTYRDDGKVAHVKVCWDTDLGVSRDPEAIKGTDGSITYPNKAGKYTPNILTEGLVNVNGTWDGPIDVVKSKDANKDNIWGGALGGIGTVRSAVTMEDGTLLYVPDQFFDEAGKNITASVLTTVNPISFPQNGSVIIVVPKHVADMNQTRLRLLTPVPNYANTTLQSLVAGGSDEPNAMYRFGTDGQYLVADLNIDVYTRTFDGTDNDWWSNNNVWTKSGDKEPLATEPLSGTMAIAKLNSNQTIKTTTRSARSLTSVTFESSNKQTSPTATLEPFDGPSGETMLTFQKTILRIPLKLNKKTIRKNNIVEKKTIPPQLLLGDVTIDTNGGLTLPDWEKIGNSSVISGVTVHSGGTLTRGGATYSVPTLRTFSGATLDLTGGMLTVGSYSHIATDPESNSLNVTLPATEGKILAVTTHMQEADMAFLPKVNISSGTTDTYTMWKPDGLYFYTSIEEFRKALPKPNGAGTGDTTEYTPNAAQVIHSATSGVVPKQVIASTKGETEDINAETTSAVLDAFSGVVFWAPNTQTVYIQYEFGFSSFTYSNATTLRAKCRVRNNNAPTQACSFRAGVTLKFYCNSGETLVKSAVVTEETAESVVDILVDEVNKAVSGALTPGKSAKFTVKALPPGTTTP